MFILEPVFCSMYTILSINTRVHSTTITFQRPNHLAFTVHSFYFFYSCPSRNLNSRYINPVQLSIHRKNRRNGRYTYALYSTYGGFFVNVLQHELWSNLDYFSYHIYANENDSKRSYFECFGDGVKETVAHTLSRISPL